MSGIIPYAMVFRDAGGLLVRRQHELPFGFAYDRHGRHNGGGCWTWSDGTPVPYGQWFVMWHPIAKNMADTAELRNTSVADWLDSPRAFVGSFSTTRLSNPLPDTLERLVAETIFDRADALIDKYEGVS